MPAALFAACVVQGAAALSRDDHGSCAAEALAFFEARDKHGDFAPGSGRWIPSFVGHTLRTLQAHHKATEQLGKAVIFDVGANKGRYSAALFDATCDTIPRREAAAQQRGDFALDRTVPAGLIAATSPGCPTIFAVEADAKLCASAPRARGGRGFPSAQFRVINAAAYSHDATLTFAADPRTGAETGRLVKEGMTGEALARSRSKRVERVRARSVDSLLAAHGPSASRGSRSTSRASTRTCCAAQSARCGGARSPGSCSSTASSGSA